MFSLRAQRPVPATNSQANLAVRGPLLCRQVLERPCSLHAGRKHFGEADVRVEGSVGYVPV